MYVSVPKNYGGVAFSHSKGMKAAPPTLPMPPPPPKLQEPHCEGESKCESENKCESESKCENCGVKEKNPLSCLFEAFRGRQKGGFDTEDFLLIGLIALLLNKEGNEDIVLILAMLLLT